MFTENKSKSAKYCLFRLFVQMLVEAEHQGGEHEGADPSNTLLYQNQRQFYQNLMVNDWFSYY